MNRFTKSIAVFLMLSIILCAFAGCRGKEDAESAVSDSSAQAVGEKETDISKILPEYIKAYNKTKATGTFLGKNEKVTISNILIKNEPNAALEKIINGIINAAWENETNMQLPPYTDKNKFAECMLTAEDIESASMVTNSDGTVTVHIVPKAEEKPTAGKGSQGKAFNVFEGIETTMEDMKASFTDGGNLDKNLSLYYSGGTITATFDPSTYMISSATYIMDMKISVINTKFYGIKMSQASLDLEYKMMFPQ